VKRRKPAPRTFHGGPEIRQPKSKHSKHNRGLKGWNEGESSGRVRVIVRDGHVVDKPRYRQIEPEIKAAVERISLRRKRNPNPARGAESHVTAQSLAGRGAPLIAQSPAGLPVNNGMRADRDSLTRARARKGL
jgi:hypothetical protein